MKLDRQESFYDIYPLEKFYFKILKFEGFICNFAYMRSINNALEAGFLKNLKTRVP